MKDKLHILVYVSFITRQFLQQFMFHFSPRTANLSPRVIPAVMPRTIRFFGSLALLVSGLTGSSIAVIPLMFQQAGWLTCVFGFFSPHHTPDNIINK
jgi:hypothetical protein